MFVLVFVVIPKTNNLICFLLIYLCRYKTITHYNFNIRKFNLKSGTLTQLVWDDTIKLEVGVAFREDTQNTCIVAQYVLPGNGRYSKSFKPHVKKPLPG